MKTFFRLFSSLILSFFLFSSLSCGGGGGGGTSNLLGNDLNANYVVNEVSCTGSVTGGTFSSGDFSVSIADGAMSSCVNSTNPQIADETSVPNNMDIGTGNAAEINATDGAAAYTFSVGERSFNVSDTNAVNLTIPYDDTSIDPLKEDGLHLLVRILNNDDGSLVDVPGTVDKTNNTVTISMTGLPSSMTVVVVYNPTMAALASTATADTSLSTLGSLSIKATPFTWGAGKWCVVYDAGNADILSEFATYQAANPSATLADMMQNQVAANAVRAQNYYVAAGFRQPLLKVWNTAADPCGGTLGTTARFNIHVRSGGSSFNPPNTNAVVDVKNYYGTLYLGTKRLNLTTSDTLGPVLASVAHEMLHSSQAGYDYGDPWSKTLAGYEEGTATTYGRTIGVNFGTVSNMPYVRLDTDTVFKLSNYLTQNAVGTSTDWADSVAYSNQDFFTYVGRQYNGNNLSYLAGLFEQMKIDVSAQSSTPLQYQPPRTVLYGAMDLYFQGNFAGQPTLREIYIDFIKERAMGHNTASQLRGGEPTTAGTFNSSLFDTGGLLAVSVDPLAIGSQTQTFGSVAPFATRAIKITPSKTIAAGGTGATIEVRISPAGGQIGTDFGGAAYQNGSYQALESQNFFPNFGFNATDEIIILVANLKDSNATSNISVTITGENGSGDSGGGGANSFTFTEFTLPGESMSPAYMSVTPDFGTGFIIIAVASTTDTLQLANLPNLQLQLNTSNITGPGTYLDITNDVTSSDAALLYSGGVSGTGKVFLPTTGASHTLNIDSWSTEIGGTINGTVRVNMEDSDDSTRKGVINASFTAIVGFTGNL